MSTKPPRQKKQNVYERLKAIEKLAGQLTGCSSGGTGSGMAAKKPKATFQAIHSRKQSQDIDEPIDTIRISQTGDQKRYSDSPAEQREKDQLEPTVKSGAAKRYSDKNERPTPKGLPSAMKHEPSEYTNFNAFGQDESEERESSFQVEEVVEGISETEEVKSNNHDLIYSPSDSRTELRRRISRNNNVSDIAVDYYGRKQSGDDFELKTGGVQSRMSDRRKSKMTKMKSGVVNSAFKDKSKSVLQAPKTPSQYNESNFKTEGRSEVFQFGFDKTEYPESAYNQFDDDFELKQRTLDLPKEASDTVYKTNIQRKQDQLRKQLILDDDRNSDYDAAMIINDMVPDQMTNNQRKALQDSKKKEIKRKSVKTTRDHQSIQQPNEAAGPFSRVSEIHTAISTKLMQMVDMAIEEETIPRRPSKAHPETLTSKDDQVSNHNFLPTPKKHRGTKSSKRQKYKTTPELDDFYANLVVQINQKIREESSKQDQLDDFYSKFSNNLNAEINKEATTDLDKYYHNLQQDLNRQICLDENKKDLVDLFYAKLQQDLNKEIGQEQDKDIKIDDFYADFSKGLNEELAKQYGKKEETLDEYYKNLQSNLNDELNREERKQNEVDNFYGNLQSTINKELDLVNNSVDKFYYDLANDLNKDIREEQKDQQDTDDFYANLANDLNREIAQEKNRDDDVDAYYATLANDLNKEISVQEQKKNETPETFYNNLTRKLSLQISSEQSKKTEVDDFYKKLQSSLNSEISSEQFKSRNEGPKKSFSNDNKHSKNKLSTIMEKSELNEEARDSKLLRLATNSSRNASAAFNRSASVKRDTIISDGQTAATIDKIDKIMQKLGQRSQTLKKNDTSNEVESYLQDLAIELNIDPQKFMLSKKQKKVVYDLDLFGTKTMIESQNLAVNSDSSFSEDESIIQPLKELKEELKETVMKQKPIQKSSSIYPSDALGQTKNMFKLRTKKLSSQPSIQSEDIVDTEEQELESRQVDVVKNKFAINLLTYKTNHNARMNHKLQTDIWNLMKRQQHEVSELKKREQILKEQQNRLKKNIHFCFFFACPLVLSYHQKDSVKEIYKLVPQLDQSNEFQKITDRLASARRQLNITKRQCTIDSLKEILSKKPLALHFSGHGILNTFESVGNYHYLHADEGDFLLLETNRGDSQLVSRKNLKEVIKASQCELQLVVVATCHSEFVGKIFLEAGARHVVCIKQTQEVQDQSIITFSDNFYESVFSQSMDISQAFRNAMIIVQINHGPKEEAKFKLLSQKDNVIDSAPFGEFKKGKYRLVNTKEVALPLTIPKVPLLIGRNKDMFKLIKKILSPQSARVITLMGLPGIGKSSLVRNTLHYINERSLLAGGCIFLNLRTVITIEYFIKTLNYTLVSENQELFGNIAANSSAKENLDHLVLLLSKINLIEGEILLVLDNPEDLIQQQKSELKDILSLILWRVPKIKILLASRLRLTSMADFREDIILIHELSPQNSAELFKQSTREIPIREIKALLNEKPNFKKYPDEANKPEAKNLHEHHLMTLLGGNPQSIVLVAPLLAEQEKKYTLSSLYKLMTSQPLRDIIRVEGIQDPQMASMRLSLQITIQMIHDTDPESMSLFFLLGMMPKGITATQLDKIWARIRSYDSKNGRDAFMNSQIDLNMSLGNTLTSSQSPEKRNQESSWRRAFNTLKKVGVVTEELYSGGDQDDEQIANNVTKANTIKLPKFIQSFAEAMIEDHELEKYHNIIADEFFEHLHDIYVRVHNVKFNREEDRICEQMLLWDQQNLRAFFNRMVDSKHIQVFKEDPKQSLQRKATKDAIKTKEQQKVQKRSDLLSQLKDYSAQGKQDNLLTGIDSKKYLNIMLFLKKYDNPRDAPTPKQRAYWWWRWAMTKITEHNEKKQLNDIVIGGFDMEEVHESDSEGEISSLEHAMSSTGQRRSSKSPSLMARVTKAFSSKFLQKIEKIQQNSEVSFKKGSLYGRAGIQRRATSNGKNSLKMNKKLSNLNKGAAMSQEELVCCFYLATLMLMENYTYCLQLIEKYCVKFDLCSDMFKGNYRRIQAFCGAGLQIWETEEVDNGGIVQMLKSTSRKKYTKEEIFECLQQAMLHYKKAGSNWGCGLTYFTTGKYQQLLREHEKGNDDSNFECYIDLDIDGEPRFDPTWHLLGESPIDNFKLADYYFTQVNHLRGMALSNSFIVEIIEDTINYCFYEEPAQVSYLQQKQESFRKKYFTNMAAFRNTSDVEREKDFSICRTGGEEFALLTEVVRMTEDNLFEKTNDLTNRLGGYFFQQQELYGVDETSSDNSDSDNDKKPALEKTSSEAMKSLANVLKQAKLQKQNQIGRSGTVESNLLNPKDAEKEKDVRDSSERVFSPMARTSTAKRKSLLTTGPTKPIQVRNVDIKHEVDPRLIRSKSGKHQLDPRLMQHHVETGDSISLRQATHDSGVDSLRQSTASMHQSTTSKQKESPRVKTQGDKRRVSFAVIGPSKKGSKRLHK